MRQVLRYKLVDVAQIYVLSFGLINMATPFSTKTTAAGTLLLFRAQGTGLLNQFLSAAGSYIISFRVNKFHVKETFCSDYSDWKAIPTSYFLVVGIFSSLAYIYFLPVLMSK